MVAGKFRKEVTSTVLWLMNYGIRAQCFKVTPFALDEKLFLNIEQILPVKDTEDCLIDRWLRKSMGMFGLSLNIIVTGEYAQSDIAVNRGDKEENERCFDFLYSMKDKGGSLFDTGYLLYCP